MISERTLEYEEIEEVEMNSIKIKEGSCWLRETILSNTRSLCSWSNMVDSRHTFQEKR